MESIIYEGAEEFAELINEIDRDVHVIGHYDEIKDIFTELIRLGYEVNHVELSSPDYSEDEDEEYWLSTDDLYVDIFPNTCDGEYIRMPEHDAVFVFENVDSGFVKANKNHKMMFEVDFCDGDCENCHSYDGYIIEYSHDINGKINGFTRSKTVDGNYYSESFYSSDPKMVQFQLVKKNF